MKSSRPYLLRALNQWILDNGLTPYLLVDAGILKVQVPQEYVTNGKIVLNIHPQAVQDLELGNLSVRFSARFASGHKDCYIPIPAVLAIYSSENGKGMFFSMEDLGDEDFFQEDEATGSGGGTTSSSGGAGARKASHLTVVK